MFGIWGSNTEEKRTPTVGSLDKNGFTGDAVTPENVAKVFPTPRDTQAIVDESRATQAAKEAARLAARSPLRVKLDAAAAVVATLQPRMPTEAERAVVDAAIAAATRSRADLTVGWQQHARIAGAAVLVAIDAPILDERPTLDPRMALGAPLGPWWLDVAPAMVPLPAALALHVDCGAEIARRRAVLDQELTDQHATSHRAEERQRAEGALRDLEVQRNNRWRDKLRPATKVLLRARHNLPAQLRPLVDALLDAEHAEATAAPTASAPSFDGDGERAFEREIARMQARR